MVREFIEKQDSLNQGREKLNRSIDRSYDADTKSDKAIKDSGEALTTSLSVRDELNQVVIEGDSSVEAAQARVGADGTNYSVLKERLDVEHEKVTAQSAQNVKLLEQIYVDVEEFGAKINSDSTIHIQNAIDFVFNQGGGTVLLKGIYLVDKIYVKPNVRLLGYSNSKSGLKKVDPTNADDYNHVVQIGVNDVLDRQQNITIENLLIDGGRSTETTHSQTNHGVLITNADNIKILDCTIKNNHGDGVWVGFYRPKNVLIQRNHFENNGRVSVVIDTTDYGVRILDNFFEGGFALDIEQDGLDISTGSKGCLIDGNTFNKCTNISIVTPTNVISEINSANHTFTNNTFYDCKNTEDDLIVLTSYNLIFEKNRFYNCSAKRYFFYCVNTHKIIFNSNVFSKCYFGDDFFYFYIKSTLGTKEGIFTNNIISAFADDPNRTEGISIFYVTDKSLGFNKSIVSNNSVTTNTKYFSYGDLWREGSVINGNSIRTNNINDSICFYTVEAGSHFLMNGNSLAGFKYSILTYNSSEDNYSKVSHSNSNSQKLHESFQLGNNQTFTMQKNGIKYEIYLDETGTLKTRSLPS